MLGCAKRNQWDLMKYIFLIPFYWGMMSVASVMAMYQLIFKPHYWEKTVHGYHLLNKAPRVPQVARVPQAEVSPAFSSAFRSRRFNLNTKYLLSLWFDNLILKFTFPGQIRKISDFVLVSNFLKNKYYYFLNSFALGVLLTIDFLFAKILFSQEAFALYCLLSVTCKFAVILTQNIAYFTNEIVSKNKKTIAKFYDLVLSVFLFQWVVFVVLGFEGQTVSPLIFGNLSSVIVPYLSFFVFACMCYAVSYVISAFHAKRKNYVFMYISLFFVFAQSILSFFSQSDMKEMVMIFAYVGAINITAIVMLHVNKDLTLIVGNNIGSIFALFKKLPIEKSLQDKHRRVLIFNWRDIKHVWAGGAEVYIHEIAKRWVKDGNQVTIFCGNDSRNIFNEQIDGIDIIRRGGSYTVYFFAFIYYMLKFKNKYDVIVDCENGIPFFSPFFIRRPVTLLVHHVHQEVFRNFLRFPWRQIATFLEGKVMPFIYQNNNIITVSESSKKEILKLGYIKEENIEVIYNGAYPKVPFSLPKTKYPSFVYLGRLKEYKNVDIAIKAFAVFLKEYPSAKLSIVGSGEYEIYLKNLVKKLHITTSIQFVGRVTEEKKTALLSQSWAMVQPSQVEGWGITVIESNLVGTPVIASAVNGLKDSVVDGITGILVKVKDVNQFTNAMKKMTQDKSYRKILSQNAYLWAKNFDWDKSAYDFFQVIERSMELTLDPNISKKVSLVLSEE